MNEAKVKNWNSLNEEILDILRKGLTELPITDVPANVESIVVSNSAGTINEVRIAQYSLT